MKGVYQEAKELYKKALSIHQKLLGPGNIDVANDLNLLALLEEIQVGQYVYACNSV